jgi:hypothetical protein
MTRRQPRVSKQSDAAVDHASTNADVDVCLSALCNVWKPKPKPKPQGCQLSSYRCSVSELWNMYSKISKGGWFG